MKKGKKFLCMLFSVVMLISCMATSVWAAETTTQDGLNAVIQTDKDTYAANEDIQINVTVTNTNAFEVKNVSIENFLPDDLTLKSGSLKSDMVNLKPNETLTLSCVAVLEKSEEPTSSTPNPGDPGTTSSAPTSDEPEDTGSSTKPNESGTISSESNTSEDSSTTSSKPMVNPNNPPQTGDNFPIFLSFLILIISAIAVVTIAIAFKKEKKTRKIISLILCCAIGASSITAVGFIRASAEETTGSFTVNKAITVKEQSYSLVAKVYYLYSADDVLYTNIEQEIVNLLELNNGQLPEITVDEDDNIPSFIDGKFSDVIIHNFSDAKQSLYDIKNIMQFKNPDEEFTEGKLQNTGKVSYYRLEQQYQGIPVYGKELVIATSENGEIISLSGDYDPNLSLSVTPTISESTATEKVREASGWSDSIISKGLAIYNIDVDTPVLVYHMTLSNNLWSNGEYFVSALNGDIISSRNVSSINATGLDLDGKECDFNVTQRDGIYYMEDPERNIIVYDALHNTGKNLSTIQSSSIDSWDNPEAVSAVSNMIKAYDFYLNILGQHSHDGAGGTINIAVNYREEASVPLRNAYSMPDDHDDSVTWLAFGDGDLYAKPTDIAAHEYTHAITRSINNLEYRGESGALNESYSDIFGNLIERNLNDSKWLIGESLESGAIRSMSSPNDYRCPDEVGGKYYYRGFDQSILVHTNSSVFNHAAYLIASNGINDLNELATLYYRSMFYLTPTSTFKDARAAVLRAGKDMQLNSQKMNAIVEAFNKVKIVRVDEAALVTGHLSGRVIDANTRSAIPGAEIVAVENFDFWNWYTFGAGTTYADANGNFSLSLSEGKYKVVVSAPGYKSVVLNDIRVDAFGVNYLENSVLLEELGTSSDHQTFYVGGMIKNSTTGNALADVTIKFRKNHGTQSGPYVQNKDGTDLILKTDVDGKYYTSALDYGYYTLEASKEGYITGYKNILVSNSDTISLGQDVVLTPTGSTESSMYRVVLTWGENPRDLDSHVEGKLENGSSFHVYYGHKSQYDGEIEVCNLDVDDRTSYGPETITLNTTSDLPYYYYIKRYSGSGTVGTSEAQINVYQSENLVATFNVPTDQGDGDYWNVFAIVNGELIAKNTITSNVDTSYAN